MSPRKQREFESVKKIIEQEWTLFKDDAIKRCRTRGEVVSALRQLKTSLLEKIKVGGFNSWLAYTAKMIDDKISVLTADQSIHTKKAALDHDSKQDRLMILPFRKLKKGVVRKLAKIKKRMMKPPESN